MILRALNRPERHAYTSLGYGSQLNSCLVMDAVSVNSNWFSFTVAGIFFFAGFFGYRLIYKDDKSTPYRANAIGKIVGLVCGLVGLLLGFVLQLLWATIW